jgi:lipoprotein-anchoring transpeptidase ErfK/SrfK
MRTPILVAIAAVSGALIAAPVAQADTRTYWDYAKQQWFVGDSKAAAFRTWRIPREMVDYRSSSAPGTIIIDTAARRLFYVLDAGRAVEYAIGVGREGFQWSGTDVITQKAEWPTWKPPVEMIAREKEKGHILPEVMPGGLDNPLGARALYIGYGFYRIHGTTDPKSVGHAVSSGCIRLTNEDITDLYDRVGTGTRVVVLLKSPAIVVKADTGSPVPKPRLNPVAPKVLVKAVEPPKPAVKKPVASLVTTTPVVVAKKMPATALGGDAATANVRVKDDLVLTAEPDTVVPPPGTDLVLGGVGTDEVASSGPTPASH